VVAAGSFPGAVNVRAAADHVIHFAERDVGAFPAAFENAEQSGTETPEGVALGQASRDLSDDAHAIAVYQPLSLKDLDARLRFKIVSGRMKNAGIAARYQDAGNYYVVVASALEQRVDLFRAIDGQIQRVAGMEAPVALDDS